MPANTSKAFYIRHEYSGPRKNLNRVRGALRAHHGVESRLKAWRSKETKKKPVNEEIVIDTSKITPKPQLRTYARVRKALSQESTYSACSTITVTHEPVVEPLQKQQNEERKETTEGRMRSHLKRVEEDTSISRDSILGTSEKPHLTTEIKMETGALYAGFQEAMELDWTSVDSGHETAASSDEVNIFCPRCNTEVPHTAEGIQEDKIKILVTRVFYYFEQEYEDLKSDYADLDLTPFSMFHQRTAMATGVSETTLMQILKEEERRDEERQRELLQEGAACKRRRQNDGSSRVDSLDLTVDDMEQPTYADEVQTLVVRTEPPEFSYEEPEIMLPLGVQLEPGVGEIDTAQLHLDPLAVEVKTEPQDDELATTQHQELKSSELSVPVASSSVTYTETLHGQHKPGSSSALVVSSSGSLTETLHRSCLSGEREIKMTGKRRNT